MTTELEELRAENRRLRGQVVALEDAISTFALGQVRINGVYCFCSLWMNGYVTTNAGEHTAKCVEINRRMGVTLKPDHLAAIGFG